MHTPFLCPKCKWDDFEVTEVPKNASGFGSKAKARFVCSNPECRYGWDVPNRMVKKFKEVQHYAMGCKT